MEGHTLRMFVHGQIDEENEFHRFNLTPIFLNFLKMYVEGIWNLKFFFFKKKMTLHF